MMERSSDFPASPAGGDAADTSGADGTARGKGDGVIAYACADCSLSYALSAIEGKWKLPTLYVLCANGAMRYNALKRALGITNMMLSSTLKELEEYGLVTRRQYNEVPPRVEYEATELARGLAPALEAFGTWGEELRAARDAQGER